MVYDGCLWKESGKPPAPVHPGVRVIDHHMPVPWMHLPVSCSAPANENTHVSDVSFVNDVREVLLLVVEEDEWQA